MSVKFYAKEINKMQNTKYFHKLKRLFGRKVVNFNIFFYIFA